MIHLNQALKQMRKKDHRGRFVPFSLTFVSVETGELVTYKGVTLPQRQRVELETMERNAQRRSDSPVKPENDERILPLSPSHLYSTVTFKKPGGPGAKEEFRQCHIHLITRFNGEQVF